MIIKDGNAYFVRDSIAIIRDAINKKGYNPR